MTKVIRQILFCVAFLIGMSLSVSAQHNQDQKKPPKPKPPVVNPAPNKPPPNRPHRPNGNGLVLWKNDNMNTA